MDNGNAMAFNMLGRVYAKGAIGMPQDYKKANDLWLKGGELGCAGAYCNLGLAYDHGRGVEVDNKKAKYYYELAAMNGHVLARHNLGILEWNDGNTDRAFKHYILAARAGYTLALDVVKAGFMGGFVTENEYVNTLHAYQKIQDEMKSDERDKYAAYQATFDFC